MSAINECVTTEYPAMSHSHKTKCPVCDSAEFIEVFRKSDMPIYNLQLHFSREDALHAEKGDLLFLFCKSCLFAFNSLFDPESANYQIEYESDRNHSIKFVEYLDELSQRLDENFNLTDKVLVEIGCGNGQFLEHLRSKYAFRGFGVDPSLKQKKKSELFSDIQLVKGTFEIDNFKEQIDCFIIRHVLEHQRSLHDFFSALSDVNTPFDIYIEVPAWEWIINNNSINAFSYEHCSYYTKFSLTRGLSSAGIYPKNIRRGFNNEYMQYFGTNTGSAINEFEEQNFYSECNSVVERTGIFISNIKKIFEKLRDLIVSIDTAESVLWGAGGKGTNLLNLLSVPYTQMEYVVDNNPKRDMTYIPVTGQAVIAPERLRDLNPKLILLTNSTYLEEIKQTVESMQLDCDFILLDRVMEQAI